MMKRRIINKQTPFQQGYCAGLIYGHKAENPYVMEFFFDKQIPEYYEWNRGWRDWYGNS